MDLMPDLAPTPPAYAQSPDLGDLIRYYIGIFRRRRRLITISVLICLLLGVIHLATAKRMYQASTQLLILQQGARPISISNNDQSRLADIVEDCIPTQALIVGIPLVVSRAIDSVGLKNLPTLLETQQKGLDPLEEAINHLKVDRPDRMAKILHISYEAYSREEAVRTVAAITESYQQFLGDSFQKTNSQVAGLIARARDDLSRELADLERQYMEFRQKNQSLTMDKEGRSYISLRLEQLDRAANEAKIKAIQLRSQYELGQKLAHEGTGMWAIAHAMEKLDEPTAPNHNLVANAAGMTQDAAMGYIRLLTQEQQQLAERYGPRNTRVQEIKEQIERIQEGTRETRRSVERGEVRDLLASVEQSLKAIEGMRAEFKREFDKDLEEAKKIENDLLVDSNFRNSLERQRLLFNTVVDQLKQAQFTGGAYSSITSQVVELPNSPTKAYRPKKLLTLAMALVAGLMSGMMGALVTDRLDQRIRSLEEARTVLGVPVLGQIPQIPADRIATVGAPGLISHALPRSIWAEAYRVTRTHIEVFRRNRRIQTILVTSPYSGDGKTATASNLAISLARAGRKVLLIDADLWRPFQDQLHHLHRGKGLVDALKDLLPVSQIVQHTPIEHLDVITTGPEVPNPAELLTSPRLVEFLNEACKLYDLIIIDSSSLLAVADPAIIGAAVDGVLLVVHAATIKRHDAYRTMDLLRTLGIPVLGTLINWIDREMDGFKYSNYDRARSIENAAELDPPVEGGTDPPGDPMEPRSNGHVTLTDAGDSAK
jgi:polysaccharide biosynthesis transport protein